VAAAAPGKDDDAGVEAWLALTRLPILPHNSRVERRDTLHAGLVSRRAPPLRPGRDSGARVSRTNPPGPPSARRAGAAARPLGRGEQTHALAIWKRAMRGWSYPVMSTHLGELAEVRRPGL